MTDPAPIATVEELSVVFRTRHGLVNALDNVSLAVGRGEMVGIVGESGSGKSVTAYAIMRLLDMSAARASGSIRFFGRDLLAMSENELAAIRGAEMSMIFQNPRTAINPIRPVGRQLADVLRAHCRLGRKQAEREAIERLAAVKIPDPARRARAYPFELSGGMCQRVMIALALACAPSLLIADEPTTGLDVTTQAVIMDLIRAIAKEQGMATLFITHDLALASEYCDRIVVMHAGQVVEAAPTMALFGQPRHPYTQRLIAATPQANSDIASVAVVPGGLPDLTQPDLPFCRYSRRCERYLPLCDAGRVPVVDAGGGHVAACWRLD